MKNHSILPLPSSRRSLAARAESGAGGGKRISQNEFTEKAWQAVVAAPDVAKAASNQIVETEHLLKALLEQPNGLARRCVAAAGGDPTLLLERVDAFIKRQPKVSGDSGQVLGRNLEALVTRAEGAKAQMGDDFVSVDHLLLACCDDQRCGAQLLAAVGVPKAKLEEAVKQIRGALEFSSPPPLFFFFCPRGREGEEKGKRRQGKNVPKLTFPPPPSPLPPAPPAPFKTSQARPRSPTRTRSPSSRRCQSTRGTSRRPRARASSTLSSAATTRSGGASRS